MRKLQQLEKWQIIYLKNPLYVYFRIDPAVETIVFLYKNEHDAKTLLKKEIEIAQSIVDKTRRDTILYYLNQLYNII